MNQPTKTASDDGLALASEWFSLIRDGCTGQTASFRLRVSRIAARLRREKSPLSEIFANALAQAGGELALGRDVEPRGIDPVDADTRLALIVTEYPVIHAVTPVFSPAVKTQLEQLIQEWRNTEALTDKGLHPSRTLLMSGPPGVGKSMSARYLAKQLDIPLLTLNLAAAVNSYLGKTGSNLARVLDHAQKERCILFLDEFDALAKRRDDAQDVGELKRVVNVLLQAIDDWAPTSLLIAATNHEELLDKAVFRRFDAWIRFPSATLEQVKSVLIGHSCPPSLAGRLAKSLEGRPISDAVKLMERARRRVVLAGTDLDKAIAECVVDDQGAPEIQRAVQAAELRAKGMSQRDIARQMKTSHSTVNRLLRGKRD